MRVLLMLFFFTSCKIDNGKIIDKKYIPKHKEVRCRVQHIGKVLTPITEVVHIEDEYILTIQNREKIAEITIDKSDFSKWEIGQWYDKKLKK